MIRSIAVLLALLAMAIGSLAQGAEVKVEGVLKAVDAKDRTLTVEKKTAKGAKELSLEVAEEAGDLSSLKVGGDVSLAYDSTLEVVTKILGPVVNGGGAKRAKATANPICRVTLHMAEDGTSTGRVESAPEGAPDKDAGVPHSVAGGLKRVVFVFPDDNSCEPFRGSINTPRNPAKYLESHKAVLLWPTDGGESFLTFPTRVRLPVTLVADVEAVEAQAHMAMALLQNPQTLNALIPKTELHLITDNALKTVDVSHRHSAVGGWKDKITERGALVSKGYEYEVTDAPHMRPGEPWIAYCSGFLGPQRQYKGVRVKRLEITGRLAGPPLGVQLKEAGDAVVCAQVFPRTLAEKAGVKVGDKVIAVGGKPASGLSRAMQLLAVTELGDTWDLEVMRDGTKKTFSIKCGWW